MQIRVYVHLQGPAGLLAAVGRRFDATLNYLLSSFSEEEVDAIFVSLTSVSDFERGFKVRQRKVRKNFTRRLITGGSVHYNCAIELEVLVADAEVVDIETESDMARYIGRLLVDLLPTIRKGVALGDLDLLEKIIGSVPDALI